MPPARRSAAPSVVHQGKEYDLGGRWRSMTVNEAISHALGEEVTADTSSRAAAQAVRRRPRSRTARSGAAGSVLLEMYEHLAEDKTLEPTFYRDFPTDVSPLTRQHRVDPRLAERWDLVCFGAEIGTAYSELDRPGRAAAPSHRAVAAGRGRRPGGDGAGRGLPRGAGVRHAAVGRSRHGRRPDGHDADRQEHPGDGAVPAGPDRHMSATTLPSSIVEPGKLGAVPHARRLRRDLPLHPAQRPDDPGRGLVVARECAAGWTAHPSRRLRHSSSC